jgi:hypothetical protein
MTRREAGKVQVGDTVLYNQRRLKVEGIVAVHEDPKAAVPLFVTKEGEITYRILTYVKPKAKR